MTEEQKQFVDKCSEEGFSSNQMIQIRCGLNQELTIEQVKVYARTEFDYWQMYQIREGFCEGLSMEQVSIFARPEFTYEQMYEIRKMLHKYKRFSTVQKKVALMILES